MRLICIPVLTSPDVGLAEEVSRLQAENAHAVEECTRLAAENSQLAQDHTRFRDHSVKMTKELKTRNQELNSKCSLLRSYFVDLMYAC